MSKKTKGFRQPKENFSDVGYEPTEGIKEKQVSKSFPPQRPLPNQERLISVKQFMLGRTDSLARAFVHVELLEQGNRIRKLSESRWKALYQQFLTTPRG